MVISNLANAIGKVALGDMVGARELVDGVARSLNGRRQEALPGIDAPDVATASEALRDRVNTLFAYWQKRCSHEHSKPTQERLKKIAARLREGYGDAEIRKAIDGAAEDAYVNEDSGRKYDDIELICRNGARLESFIERGVKATGEVQVDAAALTPIDEKISNLRREMADLKKTGRANEYKQRAEVLADLVAKRKGKS